MTASKELEQARVDWERARDATALEHVAWALLQKSRKELIASYRSAGMSAAKAQAEFDKHMQSHSERYGVALERLSITAESYGVLLRKSKKKSAP